MTEKQIEQRKERLQIAGGICEVCGKPLYEGQPQGAHIISNSKMNREKFGSFFIDSVANIKIVCSLDCNDKADISHNGGMGAIVDQLIKILEYEIKKGL